jgi:hypothetical protein
VFGIGAEASLASGIGAGLLAHALDRHGEERHRDALPRREQHVEFAASGERGDLVGQVQKFIGGVAHGRDHDDDLVARLAGLDDALRHSLDALRIGERRAAVLLHDQAHWYSWGSGCRLLADSPS